MHRVPVPLILFIATACGVQAEMRTSVRAGPTKGGREIKANLAFRTTMEHEDAVGISGSCLINDETWMVTERNPHLLRLTRDGTISSIPIEGAPAELDMEGLACKDGRFYLSTESEDSNRNSDVVLVVEVQGSSASVVDTLVLRYPEGLMAGVNQGLEGICIAGDYLIAAGEVLRTDSSGQRQAPILRKRLGDDDTFLHWVNLTSSTGKLSGLDCRMRGNAFEVFAIERHYEVSRILQFELSASAAESETVIELGHLLRDTENFESIIVDDRGEVRLSNDNQYKTITGPSQETVLEIIPEFAR